MQPSHVNTSSEIVFIPTWHYDNGHAWLAVPESEVIAYGIKPSNYSYIDIRTRVIYLEEDVDANQYLKATSTMASDFSNIDDGESSPIRDLPRVEVA